MEAVLWTEVDKQREWERTLNIKVAHNMRATLQEWKQYYGQRLICRGNGNAREAAASLAGLFLK